MIGFASIDWIEKMDQSLLKDGFTSNPRVPFQLSSDRAPLSWPQGKSLIVHVVVNVEYWAFDELTPRSIVIPPHGRQHVPDIPNYSWSEYGNRCGMPRLLKLFDELGIPVGASMNASVIDAYPSLAKAILDAKWELIGHGHHQRSLKSDAVESETIGTALHRLKDFSGSMPRGWMSPGWTETFDTPDILRGSGVEYVYQWVIDDLPNWMRTTAGPLLSLPYALDINDSVVSAIEKHSSAEMSERIRETAETFSRESKETGQPRILTIPMHPHLSGVPHRINHLRRLFDELQSRHDTCFLHGSAIADWYMQQVPAPDWAEA